MHLLIVYSILYSQILTFDMFHNLSIISIKSEVPFQLLNFSQSGPKHFKAATFDSLKIRNANLTFCLSMECGCNNNNNNNNCLKSNIQCIEIRVQWTVHLGSSHIQCNAFHDNLYACLIDKDFSIS